MVVQDKAALSVACVQIQSKAVRVVALTKFCPWRGCKAIIPIGQRYCDKHMEAAGVREADRQAHYDATVRLTQDKQYHDFYLSGDWELVKAAVHNKYHGLCLYSYVVDDMIDLADAVHHIEPLREAWAKRFDMTNLIPLSATVHGRIEAEYKRCSEAKTHMQEVLRECLVRWEQRFPKG